MLFEDTGEVLGGLETAGKAYLLDGHLRVPQQLDRFVDPDLVQVVQRGEVQVLGCLLYTSSRLAGNLYLVPLAIRGIPELPGSTQQDGRRFDTGQFLQDRIGGFIGKPLYLCECFRA